MTDLSLFVNSPAMLSLFFLSARENRRRTEVNGAKKEWRNSDVPRGHSVLLCKDTILIGASALVGKNTYMFSSSFFASLKPCSAAKRSHFLASVLD